MYKTINKEELKKRIDEGSNFALIEVLSPEDYNKEHIKGAINIPVREIGKKANERFNKDDELIVYCSSPTCQASPSAAKKLDRLGFTNVYDFVGGKQEWKEAGFPMEESSERKNEGCC